MNIGLIGAGNISQTHGEPIAAIDSARVVAVCGRIRRPVKLHHGRSARMFASAMDDVARASFRKPEVKRRPGSTWIWIGMIWALCVPTAFIYMIGENMRTPIPQLWLPLTLPVAFSVVGMICYLLDLRRTFRVTATLFVLLCLMPTWLGAISLPVPLFQWAAFAALPGRH